MRPNSQDKELRAKAKAVANIWAPKGMTLPLPEKYAHLSASPHGCSPTMYTSSKGPLRTDKYNLYKLTNGQYLVSKDDVEPFPTEIALADTIEGAISALLLHHAATDGERKA